MSTESTDEFLATFDTETLAMEVFTEAAAAIMRAIPPERQAEARDGQANFDLHAGEHLHVVAAFARAAWNLYHKGPEYIASLMASADQRTDLWPTANPASDTLLERCARTAVWVLLFHFPEREWAEIQARIEAREAARHEQEGAN